MWYRIKCGVHCKESILTAIIDCGVVILCMTFDGLRKIPALCRLMRTNLDVYSDRLNPFFIHNNETTPILMYPQLVQLSVVDGAISTNSAHFPEPQQFTRCATCAKVAFSPTGRCAFGAMRSKIFFINADTKNKHSSLKFRNPFAYAT